MGSLGSPLPTFFFFGIFMYELKDKTGSLHSGRAIDGYIRISDWRGWPVIAQCWLEIDARLPEDSVLGRTLITYDETESLELSATDNWLGRKDKVYGSIFDQEDTEKLNRLSWSQ